MKTAKKIRDHIEYSIIIITLLTLFNCSQKIENSAGFDFLRQNPPGFTPKIFAPGTVCTHMDDWAIRFSPHGNEIYFTVTGKNQATLVSMKFQNGTWTGPEVMPFSGQYFDYAPAINYDDTRLVFGACRPSVPDE